MKLTVRDLKQRSESFDELEMDQSVSDLAEEVKTRFGYPESVRLIYCGKILEHSKLLSAYFKETNQGFVVCIPERKQGQTQVTTVEQPSVQPSVQPTIEQNTTYNIRQIRAMLLVFMRLIKTNPILNFLHITTEEGLQSVILDPNFTSQNGPLQSILNQSSAVADSIDAKEDFPIQIPGFDIIPMNVPGLGSMSTSTSSTTGPMVSTNNGPLNTPLTTNNTESTTLTEEDKQNIAELVQLGFTQQQATIAYVNAGHDKNLAASLLFELS